MEKSQLTVLVIDDDIGTLTLIEIPLKRYGFEVLKATSGKTGLELFYAHRPDVIICDIMMPEVSGYDVLSTLRSDQSAAAVPFIFLSAKGQYADLRLGRELGADDYIVKPILYKDLIKAIEIALQRKKAFSDAATALPAKTYQVFLSYSRHDEATMLRIRESLSSHDLSAWVDTEVLEPGTPSWRKAIQKGIDEAGCVVVLLSPDAKDSRWVEAELDYAESQHKTIFPVLVRGDRSNAVPFGYTLAQWVDVVKNDFDSELQKLSKAIRKHLKLP